MNGLLTFLAITVWGLYFLLKVVGWAIDYRTRYWTRQLAKANAKNEWLDGVIVAQHERDTVEEAELLCMLAAQHRRRS